MRQLIHTLMVKLGIIKRYKEHYGDASKCPYLNGEMNLPSYTDNVEE